MKTVLSLHIQPGNMQEVIQLCPPRQQRRLQVGPIFSTLKQLWLRKQVFGMHQVLQHLMQRSSGCGFTVRPR